jgi:hypothetical protein
MAISFNPCPQVIEKDQSSPAILPRVRDGPARLF